MDRGVQMRVSYWTGWLDPQMVAVSKEVHQLMSRFPESCAVGISRHYSVKISLRHRSFGIHPSLYQIARPWFGVFERRFDISHVYTSLSDWHYLNVLGQRPIVLTLTQRGEPTGLQLLNKVSRVVAETNQLAAAAVQHGVAAEKVTVVHPGVDLELFAAAPPPALPWKCLFASSPENESELASKGVDLLLEAARRRPEVLFTILWRPFGAAADAALKLVRQRAPDNVTIIKRRVPDMQRFLTEFHFVVAPFVTVGKPCPNSILEALAVGRPVLVSDFVDIGDVLQSAGAGLTFARHAERLCEALDTLCKNYGDFQGRARACAERYFDLRQTIDAYSRVYQSVIA